MENLAWIERGTVAEITEEGYRVNSIDRPGIVTPPLLTTGKEMYTTGDKVYFFLFRDGTGKILSRM